MNSSIYGLGCLAAFINSYKIPQCLHGTLWGFWHLGTIFKFCVFPEEKPCPDVLGSGKVTVVDLAVLECTDTVIVLLFPMNPAVHAFPVRNTGTVIRIPGSSPCTHTGNPHAVAMRLEFDAFLDILRAP